MVAPVVNPPTQPAQPTLNIEPNVPEKPLEKPIPETRPEIITPAPVAPPVVEPTPPPKATPAQPMIESAPVTQPVPTKPVPETSVEPPKPVDIVTSAPPYSGFRPDLAAIQAKSSLASSHGHQGQQSSGQNIRPGQPVGTVHHSQNTFHPTPTQQPRLPTQPSTQQPTPATHLRPTNPPTQTPPTHSTTSHSMSPQTQPQTPILPQSSSFTQGHHQGHPRLRAEIPKPINPNLSQRMTSSQSSSSRLPAANQRLDQTTFNPKLNLGAPPSIPNQVPIKRPKPDPATMTQTNKKYFS